MEGIKKLDTFQFGSGDVVEMEYLCKLFEIKRSTAKRYLKALRINTMYIGEKQYFSLPTLHRILFILSKPGSPGFLFPDSKGKKMNFVRQDKNYISEVTDDILTQASAPSTLSEMAALSGSDPQLLRKFVTPPQGRLRKEKNEK